MFISTYFDLIINIEIINKLFYIVFLFFIKTQFFLYFIVIMLCQFNVYIYLIVYNLISSILFFNSLLNIEFSFIQYFHILLKLLKMYVYVFTFFTLLKNFKVFNYNLKINTLLVLLLTYLYLLTGSFWSWLEPSWTSWWFGRILKNY